MKSIHTPLPLLAAASLLTFLPTLSAQTVFDDMSATTVLNEGTNADDATVGAFNTNAISDANQGIEIDSTNWSADPHMRIFGNFEETVTRAFASTGLTGVQSVSFDYAVVDDGVQGSGDPETNPTLDFTMWGEVHPWNSEGTFNFGTSADNGGYYANAADFGSGGGPDTRPVDLPSATGIASGTYQTITETFDLGPTGFDHSADGGTPGDNVLYVTLDLSNMSNGDEIYIDNFEISPIPEPASGALFLGFLALFTLNRRRRKTPMN